MHTNECNLTPLSQTPVLAEVEPIESIEDLLRKVGFFSVFETLKEPIGEEAYSKP